MKHLINFLFRFGRAAAGLTATFFFTAAVNADQAESGPNPAVVSSSSTATAEEINVGTQALGASAAGNATNLAAVLAGMPGAQAQLKPTQNGSAFAVINLAGQASPSRVAIDLAPAKGRLVIIGMNEQGEQVDLTDSQNLSKLIGDRQLDGTETSLSFNVPELTVRAVMIYWVPETLGQELVITKVGIFTREAFVPAAPSVAAVTPEPIVPSPAVIQALSLSLAAGAPTATSTTSITSASSLPAVIQPTSTPVSL